MNTAGVKLRRQQIKLLYLITTHQTGLFLSLFLGLSGIQKVTGDGSFQHTQDGRCLQNLGAGFFLLFVGFLLLLGWFLLGGCVFCFVLGWGFWFFVWLVFSYL